MEHRFDVAAAERYGVEEAIVLKIISEKVRQNEANGECFHNGVFWTRNSIESLSSLFPYWSRKQVGRIINSLLHQKAIVVGNYNDPPCDRTRWYSLSRQAEDILQG